MLTTSKAVLRPDCPMHGSIHLLISARDIVSSNWVRADDLPQLGSSGIVTLPPREVGLDLPGTGDVIKLISAASFDGEVLSMVRENCTRARTSAHCGSSMDDCVLSTLITCKSHMSPTTSTFRSILRPTEDRVHGLGLKRMEYT